MAAEVAPSQAQKVYSPKRRPPPPPRGQTELTALLTGAGPSIQGLLSRFPEPTDVTVDGRAFQLKLIRLKPVDEVCLRANSVIMDSMDVVVVVESVIKPKCTHSSNKRCSRCSARMPGAGYVSRGSLGGLTAQCFIGDEASHLAEEAGATFMLVASEAHLRGLLHPPEMGETTREEFEATAEALGGKYVELSTETGEGVEEFLDAAARLALKTRDAREMHSRLRQLRGKRLESQSRRSIAGFKDGSPKIASHSESESSMFNDGWMQSLPSLLCTRDLGPKRKSAVELSAARREAAAETAAEASSDKIRLPASAVEVPLDDEMAPVSPVKDTLQDAGRLILNAVRNVV